MSRLSLLLALAIAATSAPPALAQTNERLYEGLDFRFVTPGARAVGMGATFVGLADDATAAASNPAGLSNLQRPEFSLEGIATNVTQTYLVSSRYPCASGCQAFGTFGNTAVLPSFGSFAVPVGRLSIAGFFNTEQSIDRDFQLSTRSYAPIATPAGELPRFGQTAENGHVSASVRNFGVGGAWVVNSRVSLGASLVVSHLDLDSYGINAPGSTGSPSACPHAPDRSESDTSASVNGPSAFLGALVKPFSRLSVGVAYYGGVRFPMTTRVCGTFATATEVNGQHVDVMLPTDYTVPSRMAIGAAVKVTREFTVLGEVARVNYSAQLSPNFQVVDFRYDTSSGLSPNNYYYDDVNEYHGGVEYKRIVGAHVVAARAGVFTDPSHSLKFRPNALNGDDTAEYYEFDVNSPTGTRFGKTVGAGMTFGNALQVDGAFSFLTDANTFVVSIVRRFK